MRPHQYSPLGANIKHSFTAPRKRELMFASMWLEANKFIRLQYCSWPVSTGKITVEVAFRKLARGPIRQRCEGPF